MGVGLDRVLFNEKLDPLIEGRGDWRGLFPEKDIGRVVGSEAHDVILAGFPWATLGVGAVGGTICFHKTMQEMNKWIYTLRAALQFV